jgi:hypothetical protein
MGCHILPDVILIFSYENLPFPPVKNREEKAAKNRGS